jgi:hypothetical protein
MEETILETLLKRFLETYCIICMDTGLGKGGIQEDSCKHGKFLGSSERLLASQDVSVSWSRCSVRNAVQVSKLAEWLMSTSKFRQQKI